jgi:hypothetical protein
MQVTRIKRMCLPSEGFTWQSPGIEALCYECKFYRSRKETETSSMHMYSKLLQPLTMGGILPVNNRVRTNEKPAER